MGSNVEVVVGLARVAEGSAEEMGAVLPRFLANSPVARNPKARAWEVLMRRDMKKTPRLQEKERGRGGGLGVGLSVFLVCERRVTGDGVRGTSKRSTFKDRGVRGD